MTVYALTVGINAYLPPVPALYGCVNDVTRISTVLSERLGASLQQVTLVNEQATRAAVIDGWLQHLGQAGPGDVALFYYGGHGGEEPAPPELVHLEGTQRLQNLICYDSNRRTNGKLVRALADKELAALIRGVAARGAHVAVLLDCCHSGSGTRDAAVGIRQWIADPATLSDADRDVAIELADPRAVGDFVPGAMDPPSSPADHVALSACQDFQVAKEITVDGAIRGAFSVALIDALAALGPASTYRSVLAAVRSRIGRTTSEQDPVLHPVDAGGRADALFCDGTIQPAPPAFLVSQAEDGWWVDAGAVHGLTAPSGTEEFQLTCIDPVTAVSAGTVRVVAVEAGRSRVEPIGWTPVDTTYRAVVSTVPLPPASIVFDAPDDDAGRAVIAALGATIASAGPGGAPSVHIAAATTATATGLTLRVAVEPAGDAGPRIRILRPDGTPATADTAGVDAAAVSKVVSRLEHIARWEQLRSLGEQRSILGGAIELLMYPAAANEPSLPADRMPLAPVDGGYRLEYTDVGGVPTAPWVFIQLRNTTDRPLYVALLDLTDRYQCHAALFATERIDGGHSVTVLGGRAIQVTLPSGRAVVPGASARDLLKIVVSEANFDASALELPTLDEPPTRGGTVRVATNTLERLAGIAITRDFGAGQQAALPAPEWAARIVPAVTVVPAAS